VNGVLYAVYTLDLGIESHSKDSDSVYKGPYNKITCTADQPGFEQAIICASQIEDETQSHRELQVP